MIKGFAGTDHIVVAICAQGGGINITRSVVKHTGSKGTRGMANAAILGGRQVVRRLPARVNLPRPRGSIAMA